MTRPCWSWLEWPLYAGAALAAVWGGLPAGRVVGVGVDSSGTLWHYWWLARCLVTGQDPRTTELMYHPIGKDLFAANGSNLVDALLSVPFQWLLGPVDYQAWFVAAVLLLNALTFRRLASAVLGSPLAIVAATLAWELNPYVLFELADGRITQALMPFVPLALLSFHRCVSPQGTVLDAVLAGALTAAQAWIYWFMGWFLAAAFAWLALLGLWQSRDRTRVLGRIGLAAAVAVALVLPPAVAMAEAMSQPGPLNPAAATDGTRAHLRQVGVAGTVPFGGPGPYMLDLPAITLAVGLWLLAGPGRLRWGGVLGVLALMAIGPEFGIGERWERVANWPFRWATLGLPFLDRLWFPYRAMSVGMVPVALGVGFVVQRVALRHRVLGGGVAAVWSALLVVGLAPLSLLPLSHQALDIPKSALWMAEQPAGAIIHLPFGMNQRFMTWQLQVPLPTLGGMGESSAVQWPEGYFQRIDAPAVKTLIAAGRQPGLRHPWSPAYTEHLLDEGFRWVVFHKERAALEVLGLSEPPGGWTPAAVDVAVGQLLAQLSTMLGPPLLVEGDMVTWDLWRQAVAPEALAATPEALGARAGSAEDTPPHVAALQDGHRDRFTRTPGFGARPVPRPTRREAIPRGTGGRDRGRGRPSGDGP